MSAGASTNDSSPRRSAAGEIGVSEPIARETDAHTGVPRRLQIDRRVADQHRLARSAPAWLIRNRMPSGDGFRGQGPSPPTTHWKYFERSKASRILTDCCERLVGEQRHRHLRRCEVPRASSECRHRGACGASAAGRTARESAAAPPRGAPRRPPPLMTRFTSVAAPQPTMRHDLGFGERRAHRSPPASRWRCRRGRAASR